MAPPKGRAKCVEPQAVLGERISLVPVQNSKVIHLIRHAQGFHNVAGEKEREAYLDPAYEDAHLTADGWRQAEELRKHVASLGTQLSVNLIVVSPLTRTIETAAGVFGGAVGPGDQQPLFMKGTAAEEGLCEERPPISAAACPPIVANELCREMLGRNPCDRRLEISSKKESFPAVDFSHVEDDTDVMWAEYGPDSREGVAQIQERAVRFLKWLEARPESHIAVVSHSAFLTLGLLPLFNGLPTHDPDLGDSMGAYFQNCEMRSYCMTSANHQPAASASPHPWAFPGGSVVLS